MKVKGILFDLDGTLCNTLEDLADSINRALQTFGLPTCSVESVRRFVGGGAKNHIRMALGDRADSELFGQVYACYVNDYADHHLNKTVAYDGMPEVLHTLHGQGILLAVVTNKPQAVAADICRARFGDLFFAVQGNSQQYPLKPDPAAALAVMQRGGLLAADTLFVGDSAVDVQTAKNAGLVSVGVTWGFRETEELKKAGADHIIDHPRQLLSLLD